jgi:HSP20 family protein
MANEKRDVQKKEAEVVEGAERTRSRRIYTPHVDIIEKKNEIELIADMPGVDEQSVDITLEKNVLEIYGKVDPDIPKDQQLTIAEYGVGDYQRVFTISDDVEREKIEASVRNGVLTVTLPKAEQPKTRKIPVKATA